MKYEDRTDTAKLRKQAVAIYIAVEKPVADDLAASLGAAATEIDFLRRGLDEAASLVRRAQAERMPLVEQLQTDHAQINTLVKLLRGALGRCRSDDPLRPEIEAALANELWQKPAPTGDSK